MYLRAHTHSLASSLSLSLTHTHSLSLSLFLSLTRSEEHTSELQSRLHLVCRLLLEKKKNKNSTFNKSDVYRQQEANDRFYEILAQEIDTAVIYYVDAVAIILSLGAFSGYEESEFFPFTNISQIAYHALYEEATEKLTLNSSPDMTTVLIE